MSYFYMSCMTLKKKQKQTARGVPVHGKTHNISMQIISEKKY